MEGGDGDNNGWIAGALMGAKFSEIPTEWIKNFKKKIINFGYYLKWKTP